MRKHFISQNAVNYLKVFTMESNNVNPHKTEAVKIHCLRSVLNYTVFTTLHSLKHVNLAVLQFFILCFIVLTSPSLCGDQEKIFFLPNICSSHLISTLAPCQVSVAQTDAVFRIHHSIYYSG